ncbi:MAG TPA: hypothetical protein VFJ87_13035 [Rhodanobacteraceae bacterium]|jgi:hypothetical protein|nr:hypothetical protein [Rhodanobacteraceae bacterium]
MRGKIIQYNGADGSGTIVAEGKQYRFALTTWRGDNAPGINKTVEFVSDGEVVTAVTAVGDDVLLKEKAAELGGKLGSLWNKIPAAAGASANDAAPGAPPSSSAAAPAATSSPITAQSILQRYGKAILIAWAVFLIASTMFNAVSITMGPMNMGKSFFDVASLFSQIGAGGGGSIKLLLILGYLSIALPMFWRDRRAWFALVIPLLAVVWAIYSVLHTLDSVGGGIIGRSIGDAFSLGFGFWLTLLAAIALAGLGVKRSLTA